MEFSSPVIVVGGGWAGLAAAVELVRHDIPVVLLESAKQLGGRARRVQMDRHPHNDIEYSNCIDNGQHLLIGAYDSTLSLLKTIGVHENDVLKRINLSFHMLRQRRRSIKFSVGNLPAPLHLIWGILSTKGLSLKDRLLGLKFSREMAKINFDLKDDESCLSLFKKYRQTDPLIVSLWEPLCLATLNTNIQNASARVFLRVLRETFSYARTDSNLLLTSSDLGAILPDPAMDYIERYGGNVRLNQRVVELHIADGTITGVRVPEAAIETKHVILATPHYISAKLLAAHSDLTSTTQQLEKLENNPIYTVYLQYPEKVKLGRDIVGMLETTSQWVFDRRFCNQPGLMAVVISGHGNHIALNNTHLCDKIEMELATMYPRWPKPLHRKVIREKRATFNCCVGISDIRPANRTNIKGLWLAGDYTDTGLPATLEGAVRSGLRSAHALIESVR